MDSNKTQQDEPETAREQSEKVETETVNETQIGCEPENELNDDNANITEELPKDDNVEQDSVTDVETSPVVESSENEVTIEPKDTKGEIEMNTNLENMNIDSFHVSDATETVEKPKDIDVSETIDEIEIQSTPEKCDDEPMDIDEILDSLNTDNETVTSSEDTPLQTDVEILPQSSTPEYEEHHIVSLIDEPDEQTKEENRENHSSENVNKTDENIANPNQAELLVREHATEQFDISLATFEKDETDVVDLEEKTSPEKNEIDVSVEDAVESTSRTVSEAVACTIDNEQSKEVIEQMEPVAKSQITGELQELPVSETVNVIDLMLENEDLFGQLLTDSEANDVDKTNVSECLEVTAQTEDEKPDELEKATMRFENTNEDVTIEMEEVSTKSEEEPVEIEEPIHPDERPAVRKECLNLECTKECDVFYDAPEFIINHFHLSKRPKMLNVCEQCYDSVTESYGELCAALEDKQPLFLEKMKHNDLVEIIDSSDDEEGTDSKQEEKTDENPFNADTLTLIENELEAVIQETLQRVDINQQMDWDRQVLKAKIDHNEKNCIEMMDDMKALQSRIDKLYTDTYNFRQNFVEEVQSLDLTTQKPTEIWNETYPPTGELKYHDIQFNTLYYTFRNKLISRWLPCKVMDKMEVNGNTEYVVRFCRDKKGTIGPKNVSRKHLAYGRCPDYRLNIATRVIALFDDTFTDTDKSIPAPKSTALRTNFYPGVIAEPLTKYTGWRYLVFFDDGWVQYVYHENLRVVCEASENVWELIEEPGAKKFIEGYVKELKNKRPIVQLRCGQRIQTEYAGKWYNGIVTKVDCSLVQIYFEDRKRYEWIYRGSTRLFPLYKKLKHATIPPNRNEATIEYIVIDDEKEPERSIEPPPEEIPKTITPPPKTTPIQRTFASQAARDTPQQKQREQKRAVAKKSTAPQPKPAIQHMNNSTIYVDEDKPKGKVVYYTAKKHIDVRKYIHHECAPSCLVQVQYNLSTYSPLSKPLLSGFERQICKTRFNKRFVIYRAPCGRRLRDMYEMHKYLRITKCKLNVDNFTFDPLIHCLAEYVIDSYVMKKPDLSEGIEKMPVQLINCYDTTTPPPCVYSAKRIPTEGVDLKTDPEFLCGCDCEDDCLDKTKCACWQLTLQGAKYGNPDTPIQDVGYEYKRLNEPVPTGIYECNAQCKCKSHCLNRVVQHPLELKLQVFKTVNRGWGLRCLNDVPKGSFICCYAGNLLTETSANEAGEDLGDEYFAELDYIEVVENMKEGYEPGVVNEESESSESDDDFDVDQEIQSRNDDSDDEFVARRYTNEYSENRRSYRTRNSVDTRKTPQSKSSTSTLTKEIDNRKDRSSSSDEEGDGIRQVKDFMASNTMPLNDEPDEERGKSIRKLFGKNEAVYIMDAKKAGNIGRYFNHSCGPNLFVQNVFVDTHDLRFPWVAFFASTHIRAGTELTWNYNYEVGSVPGKVLICQCGDEKCRGRIL